ncbi:MAG: cellulose synthase subunit BcsC-related outer membrane protein [Thiobacillaceae bacterium]|nr:cellulose synthase subunit BcsC-related outer membrane protein [Thiobacillaceae bacterium]
MRLALDEAERAVPKPQFLDEALTAAEMLPADSDLLQRLGWIMLNSGRVQTAARLFTQALARDETMHTARLGLAEALARQGAHARAHALLLGLPEAAKTRRDLADTLAEAARQRGEDDEERRWLLAALEEAGDDAGLRERLAWNAVRTRRWDEAVIAFRHLLTTAADDRWREGLATALQGLGKLEEAYRTLAGLPAAAGWRAALANELAESAHRADRIEAERAWLQVALAEGGEEAGLMLRLGHNAAARGERDEALNWWARAYALRPDDVTAEAYAEGLWVVGRRQMLERLAAQDHGPLAKAWRMRMARALLQQGQARAAASIAPQDAQPELAGVLAPRLGLGIAQRAKAGSRGGSRLHLRLSPQLSYARVYAGGWLELELSGGTVDAGKVEVPFGSALSGQPAVYTREVGLTAIQLTWTHLGAAGGPLLRLGSTPIGGPVPATATFSLGWQVRQSGHDWQAALYREPVRDSVLSLVGQRDSGSGAAWGRVLRHGVLLEGHRQIAAGPWRLSGQLRLEYLQGQAVADNRRFAFSTGLMRDLGVEGLHYLQLGPVIRWEGYRRDLSAFTWGHGGYFSPQAFTQLGLALQFESDGPPDRRFAGRLNAHRQRIERDASPCHPLPPPAGPTTCTGAYAAERAEGWAGEIELRVVLRLAPRWHLAANAGWRAGPAYRDAALGLTLHYLFEPQTKLHPEDLPAGFGGLW